MTNSPSARMTLERMARTWVRGLYRAGELSPLKTAWWAAYFSLLIASMVLLQRRWDGLLVRAPSTLVLSGVAISLILWCAGLRRTYRVTTGTRPDPWVSGATLTLACLAVLVSVTSPLSPLTGLILCWSAVVAAETLWWTKYLMDRPHQPVTAALATSQQLESRHDDRLTHVPTVTDEEDGVLPAGVMQRWTRQTMEDGRDAIYGSLRVPFAPAERTQVVHVTFCPAFSQAPEMCVEQSDGPPATIEIAQLAPYGARLEVRLEQPSPGGDSVVVEFEAFGEQEGRGSLRGEKGTRLIDPKILD